MFILRRVVGLIADTIHRRRLRWVEISITRAWSRDLPPRLFDLGDS